ncbi:MAG: trypsin-like peptidase domain-containing protein, partial [Candidatus Poribacteria bacterium]|nr:trypsin-like peptidase domain-containing protein [Candidatus Poribacteria bacterium]
ILLQNTKNVSLILMVTINEDPEILKEIRDHFSGFPDTPEYRKKREDYAHQLMVEKMVEMEVDAKIRYTNEDLKSYYEKHKNYYISEAKVRATCITLDNEDFANEVLDMIKTGKDIVEIAEELAEAGRLADGPGTNRDDPGNTYSFSRNASPRWSEFINAVFDMDIGEMTNVVFETEVDKETYYLIFRKEEYQPARNQTFNEVKKDIEQVVIQNKTQTRIIEWITELSEKAKLKTYPENIPQPSYISEFTIIQIPQQIAKKALASTVLIVMEDANGQPLSSGSGFFVGRGMIATNLHVVEGVFNGYIKQVGMDKTYRIKGIVAMNLQQDLAILRVLDIGAPILPLGNSDELQIGEPVYAVGNPKGYLEGTFTEGVVSGVREFQIGSRRIQISAPISKGSSGGPVLNNKGEVIGVAGSFITEGQNLNFAIPSNYLKELLSKVGVHK